MAKDAAQGATVDLAPEVSELTFGLRVLLARF